MQWSEVRFPCPQRFALRFLVAAAFASFAARFARSDKHVDSGGSNDVSRTAAFVKSVFLMHFDDAHPTTITFEEIWESRRTVSVRKHRTGVTRADRRHRRS